MNPFLKKGKQWGYIKQHLYLIIASIVAFIFICFIFLIWIKPVPWEVYFNKTLNNPPRPFIVKMLDNLPLPVKGAVAFDLGSGVGNETIALLKKGFNVIAIDSHSTAFKMMMNRPEIKKNKNRLTTIMSSFEKLKTKKLPKADLVVACFSLTFCPPDQFKQFWENIVSHIKPGGYFMGNTFSECIRTFGHKQRKNMTFHTYEETMTLFKDFNIIRLEEVRREANDNGKLEHYYIIIAQKK